VLKKIISPNFQRNIELFTKKLSKSTSKYDLGIRDPRSGIRNKPIPDPGSRIQGSKRQRIPNPQHRPKHNFFLSYLLSIAHIYYCNIPAPRSTGSTFKLPIAKRGVQLSSCNFVFPIYYRKAIMHNFSLQRLRSEIRSKQSSLFLTFALH